MDRACLSILMGPNMKVCIQLPFSGHISCHLVSSKHNIVTGSWVEDQRSGKGKYSYVNGDSYDGEWQSHLRNGRGTYTYAETGSKYLGTWREGKREGHGELIHANHKYVGPFKDDHVRIHINILSKVM